MGSLAVGVAVRLGAEVTAVGSGQGLEIARRMGARTVIDRSKAAVPADVGGPFDVVLDAAAAYRWSTFRHALGAGGTFVTTLPSGAFVVDLMRSWFQSTRVRFVNVKSRPADLELLGTWLAGGLEVPLDSTVRLTDVARGLKRLRSGDAKGRVGVEVAALAPAQ